MDKWIKLWLKDVGERSAATFLETLVAIIGVDAAVSVVSIDWGTALGVSATAAVLSLAKGTAARLRGDQDSASLSKSVAVIDPQEHLDIDAN